MASKKSSRALAILKEATADQLADAQARLELKQIKNRQRIAEQTREIRALALQIGVQDDQIAAYEALAKSAIGRPPKLKRRRRRKGEKHPVAVVLASSDWHTHELITLPENKHDASVGIKRAWAWAHGAASMIRLLQDRAHVESIVWWWGGDFMTNAQMPHYDALTSVGVAPVEEAMGCRDLLVQITEFFRAEFPDIPIHITTSWGNHERSTPKMEPGIAKDFTYANIIYKDAAVRFQDDHLLSFHVATDEVTITDVHGFKLATHHGHLIRFSDAIGGIATAANKLLLKLMKQGLFFDALMVGHYHRIGMEAGTRVFTNGSLCGINRYAKNLSLGDEPPAQVGFVLDLERLAVADWWRIWGE